MCVEATSQYLGLCCDTKDGSVMFTEHSKCSLYMYWSTQCTLYLHFIQITSDCFAFCRNTVNNEIATTTMLKIKKLKSHAYQSTTILQDCSLTNNYFEVIVTIYCTVPGTRYNNRRRLISSTVIVIVVCRSFFVCYQFRIENLDRLIQVLETPVWK